MALSNVTSDAYESSDRSRADCSTTQYLEGNQRRSAVGNNISIPLPPGSEVFPDSHRLCLHNHSSNDLYDDCSTNRRAL